VAALSGALGAKLISMVCRLSLGKAQLERFEQVLAGTLNEAGSLSRSLLQRVDLDTEAFNGVMAAFRMPKSTDQEKERRLEALKGATGMQYSRPSR
jgi:methenyltetrahydrofolate cyclohydrolase